MKSKSKRLFWTVHPTAIQFQMVCLAQDKSMFSHRGNYTHERIIFEVRLRSMPQILPLLYMYILQNYVFILDPFGTYVEFWYMFTKYAVVEHNLKHLLPFGLVFFLTNFFATGMNIIVKTITSHLPNSWKNSAIHFWYTRCTAIQIYC